MKWCASPSRTTPGDGPTFATPFLVRIPAVLCSVPRFFRSPTERTVLKSAYAEHALREILEPPGPSPEHLDKPYSDSGEQCGWTHYRGRDGIGGGAQSGLISNKSVKVISSAPSNSSGQPAADGSTNPTSWRAIARNSGMSGVSNTTTAYAVCSGAGIDVTAVTITVKHTNAAGPTAANTSQPATTAACGANTNLISGGASISGSDPTGVGGYTVSGSQGNHLNGSYPSNSGGTSTGNGSSTDRWTAIGATGGSASSGTNTDVRGLCMD